MTVDAKRLFITGASGKIGQFLITGLLAGGYSLTLLFKGDAPGNLPGGVRVVVDGDILDEATYSSCLEGIDTVLHMAAITHTNIPGLYLKVNTEGTARLVRSAGEKGVRRFVYVSTRAASRYGGGYSVSKLEAEQVVRESKMDWVILRPAEVYGASGREGVDMILNNINRFPVVPIIGDGSYKVAPVHVSDVVSAIVTAIDKTELKNRIYTIAGPESFTYNEFIDKVLEIKGIKKMKVHIPVPVFRALVKTAVLLKKGKGTLAMDQLPRLLCRKSEDISEAKKDLAYDPASMDERLRAA